MKYYMVAVLPTLLATEMPYQELSVGGVCAVLLWMIARDRKEHGVALLATNITTLTMQKMLLVLTATRQLRPDTDTEECTRINKRLDTLETLLDEQIALLKDALK